MKPQVAALKIQGFFTAYRLKKQSALKEAICHNPAAQLLQALDLRFQCMRAVAAAKLPIGKPIEDKAQVTRVILHVQEMAREKGIDNLEAVANIFLQNITLAEGIQSPYYNVIWKKCHDEERDLGQLVNHAYEQLRQLVVAHELPILCAHEKTVFTSEEVLMLARGIIQHASNMIIEAAGNPDLHEIYRDNQEELVKVIEQILSNYMTPSALSKSKESIHLLAESVKNCSVHI